MNYWTVPLPRMRVGGAVKDYSSYNLREASAEHEERVSQGNVRNASSLRRVVCGARGAQMLPHGA